MNNTYNIQALDTLTVQQEISTICADQVKAIQTLASLVTLWTTENIVDGDLYNMVLRYSKTTPLSEMVADAHGIPASVFNRFYSRLSKDIKDDIKMIMLYARDDFGTDEDFGCEDSRSYQYPSYY